MILLLTRKNASYDSATKTFYFNLDKQLEEKVKHIRFQSFTFRPCTTVADYPHGVLACSSALSNLSMREHVSVLKDSNHHDDTDVLCCLHKVEHNTTHVLYQLFHPVMMTLDRRNFIKKIDLYFTDMAGNRLAGDYVAGNGSGPLLSDLEDEFDAGNLKFFFDADLASSYTKEDNTQAADGDSINQWKARFPADESAVFTRSSVDGLILTTFEDETHLKAITTNPSGGPTLGRST